MKTKQSVRKVQAWARLNEHGEVLQVRHNDDWESQPIVEWKRAWTKIAKDKVVRCEIVYSLPKKRTV